MNSVLYQYLDDWTDGNYTIVQTCGACPEQYDMLDKDANIVGYFRLRHGTFTVEYPCAGGKLLLRENPKGDGVFEYDERECYLTKAYLEVIKEINNE